MTRERKLVIWDRQWAAYAGRFTERLGPGWRVVVCDEDTGSLEAELPGADALLALALPPELLEQARDLKFFLFPGAGVIRTDPNEYPAGCAVVNVYEHGIAVAEYVLAAILMHVTGIRSCSESFRAGCWAGNGRTGGAPHGEAFGGNIGIIGYGHIGQAVAARAAAFGMRVLAICEDPGAPLPAAVQPAFLGRPPDLPILLAESDFLVIACPLTPATRGMIGASELARMRPSALLINVARAEIVEEEALFQALKDRRIAAAALDVWYRYPASNDEVLHGSRFPFHELANVLATPHMSAWSRQMIERRIAGMCENLKRHERGEGPERVVLVGAWTPSPKAGEVVA